MEPIDPLVKALIDLCEKEGDFKNVADKAKVSADNLWQIINGTKLPSGNARGVGPGLRAKLGAAYPDWLTPQKRSPDESTFTNDSTRSSIQAADRNLKAAMLTLSGYLVAVDESRRRSVVGLFTDLIHSPSDPQILELLTTLLDSQAFAQEQKKSA